MSSVLTTMYRSNVIARRLGTGPSSCRKGVCGAENCKCADNVEENAADVLTMIYSLVVTLSAWAGVPSCS